MAAVKQGKYWPFHKALLAAPNGLNPPAILQIAKTAGLDTARLQQDMKDPAIAKELRLTVVESVTGDESVTIKKQKQ